MSELVIPGLWNEGDVQARVDGYLWVKQERNNDEEQPLLLRSTLTLLQLLYPNMTTSQILKETGYFEPAFTTEPEAADEPEAAEDDERQDEKPQKNGSKIPPQYQPYQSLKKVDNLSNSIQNALLDIQYFRQNKIHRKDRVHLSREEMKIRALEHQQVKLLSQRSESTTSGNSEDHFGDASSTDGPAENEGDEQESAGVRTARTINSIRALFPHLLPILYNKLRNDSNLVIGTARFKTNRKRAMCWIIGTKVYDVTSNKVCITAARDAQTLLETFVPAESANKVAKDPRGAPDYWNQLWIQQIFERVSSFSVGNPLEILTTGTIYNLNAMEAIAKSVDTGFLERKHSDSPDEHKRYLNAIENVHARLTKLLTDSFPKARLSIYGSCLSDLSLGQASDVDLSLWIPEAARLKAGFEGGTVSASKYERDMKRMVYRACRRLEHLPHEFRGMQPITRARVPVVKGSYTQAQNPHAPDGSIHFDVCFLNDIAVANSSLIREYSLVDPRVKDLMLTVKRWTKAYKINSAKDNYISSYGWMNLVIFYLQCLNFVPNLQCPNLMKAVGVTPDPEDFWHTVNNLDTCSLLFAQIVQAKAWKQPEELEDIPVSGLLYGFFEFYSNRFPSSFFAISMKRGDVSLPKLTCRKRSAFFCIEDPFETFDSHCPHDLGTPANEGCASEMYTYLREGEAYLREILIGNKKATGLWPKPPFTDPQPSRQSGKKNGQFLQSRPKGLRGKIVVPPTATITGEAGGADGMEVEEQEQPPSNDQGNQQAHRGNRGRNRLPRAKKKGKAHQDIHNGEVIAQNQGGGQGPQNGHTDQQEGKKAGRGKGRNNRRGRGGGRGRGRDGPHTIGGRGHQQGAPDN